MTVNSTLGQIMFIYRDEFACKLAQKLARKRSVDCYTLSKIEENFAYLIEDLRPQLVLVDERVYASNKELIDASLADAKSKGDDAKSKENCFKSVLLSREEREAPKFDGRLPLPLDLNSFMDQLQALVEKKS